MNDSFTHEGRVRKDLGMTQTTDANPNDCPASCRADEGAEIGPYSLAAMDLYRRGLTPVPCPSDNGKSVRGAIRGHNKWRSRPPVAWVEKMISRWPRANVGILTGLSGVTVVDVDDPALIASMIGRFGETPLITRTPSGGVHLWYRNAREGCPDLRSSEQLPVDIKGAGGIVIVPPSTRPSGAHAGRSYTFIAGSWDDLGRLPLLRPDALTATGGALMPTALRAIERGRRNKTLLRTLLHEARHCDDFDALLDCAHTIADRQFAPDPDDPFTAAEIRKTAVSAWEYESTGRNWVGREAKVYASASEFAVLATRKNGADAMFLLMRLRLSNWNRPDNLMVVPKAMARTQVIPGWAHGRYRAARDTLVEVGILEVVHEGGHGKGDPRLFRFSTPVVTKGTATGPNIIEHPSPLPAHASFVEEPSVSIEPESPSRRAKIAAA
jgi:hypothetical protein